jgi:hypothetical protein
MDCCTGRYVTKSGDGAVAAIVTSRPWRQLSLSTFREAVASSSLRDPSAWSGLDMDELAQLYDRDMTTIVDRLAPVRTARYRRRPSDPWYDADCRVAKHC